MNKHHNKSYTFPDGIDVAEVTLADKSLGQEDSWIWIMEPREIAAGLERCNDRYRERTGDDLPFAKCEARFRAAIIRSELKGLGGADSLPVEQPQ